MAVLQKSIFSWRDVETSSDIVRFKHMLDGLDDRMLIKKLQDERKGRRNEYPVECLWNSILAGIIFSHKDTASLIRELKRNAELREACGFDPIRSESAVPSKDAYHRFFKKLSAHSDLIMKIFNSLVDQLKIIFKDFGESLATDGKAILACRRSDVDADIGHKRESVPDHEETPEPYTMKWFGYKLHMLCDSKYELPITFRVTKASEHESPVLKELLKDFSENHPIIAKDSKYLSADKGYDDGEDKAYIYEKYSINPIIPPRDLGKEKMKPLNCQKNDTIYISSNAEVCCKVRPFEEDQFAPMQFMGFEKERGTLKFRCPAAAFGLECRNKDACRNLTKDKNFGRVVRIDINKDRRLFMPIHYHSYKFKREYNKRTSSERLFSRLDNMYGFENHNIRGLMNMQNRMTLSLIAMLATAIGYAKEGKSDKLRSYFQAA